MSNQICVPFHFPYLWNWRHLPWPLVIWNGCEKSAAEVGDLFSLLLLPLPHFNQILFCAFASLEVPFD